MEQEKDPAYIELITGLWPQPQCNTCRHYEGYGICPAFPEGIPLEIIRDEVIHNEPLEGQEGELFYERQSMDH